MVAPQTNIGGGVAALFTIFPPPYHTPYIPSVVPSAAVPFSQSIIFNHDARSETPKLPLHHAQPPPLPSTEPFCTRCRPSNSHSRLALPLNPKAFFNQATTTSTTSTTTASTTTTEVPSFTQEQACWAQQSLPSACSCRTTAKRGRDFQKVHAWAVTR
jgi:hypothetical protein